MDIITVDMETYYDKDYSLSKMTTESYVRDPRFEVIGVSVKVNGNETDWYSGENPGKFLNSIRWDNKAALAHNAAFDGFILSHHFGIKPAFWFDTMSMARPFHANGCGVSLKALANEYSLKAKGDEVIHALGKRRRDFLPSELEAYANYCINDTNITFDLFNILKNKLPHSELRLINTTIKMFTEPSLILDKACLETHLDAERKRKEKLLAKLGGDKAKALIMSNPKFADVLRTLGVDPPTKLSPTTGKIAFAFAKNDQEFLALQEHEDPRVQAVMAARLGTKSTLEETRTESFIGIAERGPLPIMLNYYGAHTGRFSGGDKVNLQNLPRGGALRKAICAPEDHTLITCDLSQIEARILAWGAGQTDLVEAFRQGRDVYSEFASDVYGVTVTKADKLRRFVGKTCLASSTQVLTRRGWVRITEVTTNDQLWDGVEWVNHQGVSFMGVKPTISLGGVELTPDHEILTAPSKWEHAQVLLENKTAFQSALSLATLPSSGMSSTSLNIKQIGAGAGDLFVGAPAADQSMRTMQALYALEDQLPAMSAQNVKQQINDGGNTRTPYPTTSTGHGCSTGYLQQSLDAITRQTKTTTTTDFEEYTSTKDGGMIEQRSSDMFKRYPDGMTQHATWTASITTEGMSRGISALLLGPKTRPTNDTSLIWKPVFDILNSGSRNRFTILTTEGPLIVHNCILGLGFRVGAPKLQITLAIGQGGVKVNVSDEEARRIVKLYRTKNHRIVAFWEMCRHALHNIYAGTSFDLIPGVLSADAQGIRLPSGLYITYPGLKQTGNDYEYISDMRMHRRNPDNGWTKIYDGKVCENIVQALARIVIVEHMNKIAKHYRVVMQVHDEIIVSVPSSIVDTARQHIERIMRTPPKWAPDLPVDCESGVGSNYGDAK